MSLFLNPDREIKRLIGITLLSNRVIVAVCRYVRMPVKTRLCLGRGWLWSKSQPQSSRRIWVLYSSTPTQLVTTIRVIPFPNIAKDTLSSREAHVGRLQMIQTSCMARQIRTGLERLRRSLRMLKPFLSVCPLCGPILTVLQPLDTESTR